MSDSQPSLLYPHSLFLYIAFSKLVVLNIILYVISPSVLLSVYSENDYLSCFVMYFFLIRHPSNFCYEVFSNLFIISGTKLHYQTKVDQTIISNPFKPFDKLFQH